MPAIFDNITITVLHCCSCGTAFGLPEHLRASRNEDGKSFYCPNGHPQCYLDSEVAVARKAQAKAEKDAEFWRTRANEEETAKVKLEAQSKRLRKRVANGICPCCKRTFRQLGAHMKTKHPGYIQEPAK